MSQSVTVERILDAAEQLFAEHGFAETSLRSITRRAEVNLAAVNYHFGSKKILIQAVFSRFLDPFSVQLSEALDHIEDQDQDQDHVPGLEMMLNLLVDQMMAVKPRGNNDLSVCMRLIGLGFAQGQGHLKKYLQSTYGEVFSRYLALLVRSCPQMSVDTIFWRINFILGAAVFTLSGAEALRSIAEKDYGARSGLEDILRKMVPFMAAGLRSSANYTH